MANPQKENGYTPIANEIMDKLLAFDLSRSEYKILLTVLRKTYGWNKLKDKISLSQFAKLTGLSRRGVITAVHSLVKRALLHSEADFTREAITYSFVKDYDKWTHNDSEAGFTINPSEAGFTKSSAISGKTLVKQASPTKTIYTKERKKGEKQIPPTLETVSKYCLERNNGINPQKFIDYYMARGWMIGKNKMKDWQAAIRTWENHEKGANHDRWLTKNSVG